MNAYKIENWCGQGPRIVVHPKGLPPGWTASNLSPDEAEAATKASGGRTERGRRVVHLTPELEFIQAFLLQ